MTIEFKKGINKPSTLTYIRQNGTRTWTKLKNEIVAHDLAHFAVETELTFTEAFYGLLAKGYNIEDFGLPRERRPH